MSISAKDLAKKLNISAATVSMVLNNKPGISEKTREVVTSAAHKYGFDFSRLEQKAQSSCTVQLVVYKKNDMVLTNTPFFAQLIEGIEKGCRQENISLQITYFYENQDVLKTDCDGMLILGTEMQERDFKLIEKLDMPILIMDTYFDNLKYDFITINNEMGIALAVEELVKNGCTNIGYLHSSYDIVNFDERAAGYYKNLKKHGIECNSDFVHSLIPSTDGAYESMREILSHKHNLADAYIADNDLIAAGAIRALKEHGVKICDDISVIGFDNMPICDVLEPALTTVNVPKIDFGLLAVRQLIYRINNKDAANIKIELSPELKLRASVRKNK